MIRQIVFDLGQVLIYFDKDRFIRRLNLPEEDGRLLMNEVFLSLEWAQLDRGSIDDRPMRPFAGACRSGSTRRPGS